MKRIFSPFKLIGRFPLPTLLLLVGLTIPLNRPLLAQEGSPQEAGNHPYELSWLTDGIIVGGGIGVAIVGDLLHTNLDTMTVAEIALLDPNDINAFDRGAARNYSEGISSASDYLVATCLTAPIGLMLLEGDIRDDFGTVSAMYLETLLYATFAPSIGKGAFGRIRPLIYNPDVDVQKKIDAGGEARTSFPSGHTTLAFASTIFLSTVYCDYFPESKAKPYVIGGSILLASTVGFLRYESGYHFPTDIVAGAGLGSAIGFLVPYFHRKGDGHDFSLLPSVGSEQVGLAMHYKF